MRYGWRMLAKNKGFAAIAILALAFGIGPNVAIFSIVWATFLAPQPYPHPEQLVVVWTKVKGERNPTRSDDYLQYLAQSKSFQRLDFEAWDMQAHLTGDDHEQEEETGQAETPGMDTGNLGVHMALGRDLLPSEGIPGNDHVVTLTHRLWQERFHGDPNILQRQIRIDDQPYTVVGVIEAGVADRVPGTDFMVPAALLPGEQNRHWGNVLGRLKPGVSIAQAQAELAVIDRRLAATRRGDAPKEAWTVSVEPLKNDWLDKKLERNLWLLLAAVGFVLLIACANLANLLLARGSSRQQELAVRSAMGATRVQVFTQLLTESLSLAIVGGGVGILLGWGLIKAIMAILPDLAQQSAEAVVSVNIPVLCFAVGVTMVAGILAGCAPALQAAKLNLSEILKQNSRSVGGRGRFRTQQLLVMGEFALALTLLAGAGMALHSFWNLTHVDLGVRTDHVLTGFLQPPKGPPPSNADQISANARQLLAKVEALPEVQHAALATNIPLRGHREFPFSIAGKPLAEKPQADLEIVTPSYFDTFGVQLVKGRQLNDSDQANGAPVVVVSQSFVDKYLRGMDPLDQHILLSPVIPGQRDLGTPTPRQIVGVFHGVRNGEKLNDATVPQIFVPYWQNPWPYAALAVRTSLDPGLVTKSLRTVVAQTMPGYALANIETMQHLVDTQLTGDRFGMVLFGGFAVLALVLAAMGIYGVMAFAVAQRSHEIGLRMALGAQRRDAVLLILRDGMKLALFGVGIGLAGVIGLGYLMRSTLYGVKFIDPASFAVVAGALLVVGLVASYVPARRSAKVDPMIALRQK
jgi:putative ABC transport system permease protein